jgi:hypothetical protein
VALFRSVRLVPPCGYSSESLNAVHAALKQAPDRCSTADPGDKALLGVENPGAATVGGGRTRTDQGPAGEARTLRRSYPWLRLPALARPRATMKPTVSQVMSCMASWALKTSAPFSLA